MGDCARCGHDPCTCTDKKTVPVTLIQPCAIAGCEAYVRINPTDSGPYLICKRHRRMADAAALPRRPPKPPHGPIISKEAFGLDLFEAIKTNAARLQAVKQAEAWKNSADPEDRARARVMTQEAERLGRDLMALYSRGTIAPDDARRIEAMK